MAVDLSPVPRPMLGHPSILHDGGQRSAVATGLPLCEPGTTAWQDPPGAHGCVAITLPHGSGTSDAVDFELCNAVMDNCMEHHGRGELKWELHRRSRQAECA